MGPVTYHDLGNVMKAKHYLNGYIISKNPPHSIWLVDILLSNDHVLYLFDIPLGDAARWVRSINQQHVIYHKLRIRPNQTKPNRLSKCDFCSAP